MARHWRCPGPIQAGPAGMYEIVLNDPIIAKLTRARTSLAEAVTIQDTKVVIDVAAAAKIFAQRQRLGAETIQHAATLKLDAERKLGMILRGTPKAKGGQPYQATGTDAEPVGRALTLAELGIDKKLSAQSQRIAELPDERL